MTNCHNILTSINLIPQTFSPDQMLCLYKQTVYDVAQEKKGMDMGCEYSRERNFNHGDSGYLC